MNDKRNDVDVVMLRGLRGLRQERRLTIKQLGAMVGCSGAHISQIERGIKTPSLVLVTRLSRVLECSLRELLGPVVQP